MVSRQSLKIYDNKSNNEFEKLLNENLNNAGIVENTIVKGIIEKIEDKFITVYCTGAKSSGVIDKSEIPSSELENYKLHLHIYLFQLKKCLNCHK